MLLLLSYTVITVVVPLSGRNMRIVTFLTQNKGPCSTVRAGMVARNRDGCGRLHVDQIALPALPSDRSDTVPDGLITSAVSSPGGDGPDPTSIALEPSEPIIAEPAGRDPGVHAGQTPEKSGIAKIF